LLEGNSAADRLYSQSNYRVVFDSGVDRIEGSPGIEPAAAGGEAGSEATVTIMD
jgi:hypothetical protein